MLNLESHNRPIQHGHSSDGHHILSQLLVFEFGPEKAFNSRQISRFDHIARVVKVDIIPQAASKYLPLPEF